jgi:hypothetical protein
MAKGAHTCRQLPQPMHLSWTTTGASTFDFTWIALTGHALTQAKQTMHFSLSILMSGGFILILFYIGTKPIIFCSRWFLKI